MTKQPREVLTKKKRESIAKEICEESFIIGCSIASGIKLKLERKIKTDSKLQRFNIVEVENEIITQRINEEMEEWEKETKNVPKILKRDVNKSKQNITYNALMRFMKEEYGQKFNFEITRGSNKNIKRTRILTFNGLEKQSIQDTGKQINDYLVKMVTISHDMKRKKCQKIVNSIDPSIYIPLIHPSSSFIFYNTIPNFVYANTLPSLNGIDYYSYSVVVPNCSDIVPNSSSSPVCQEPTDDSEILNSYNENAFYCDANISPVVYLVQNGSGFYQIVCPEYQV